MRAVLCVWQQRIKRESKDVCAAAVAVQAPNRKHATGYLRRSLHLFGRSTVSYIFIWCQPLEEFTSPHQTSPGILGLTRAPPAKGNAMSSLPYKQVELAELSISPTDDWANLGGAFRGIPQPVYFGGTLFVFTRNNDNTLGMCTLASSGTKGAWSSWGGTLAFAPAVAQAQNGALGVIAAMQNGQVQISYINPFTGVYTPWVGITGGGSKFVGPVQLTRNVNSRLEAFAIDTNGMMWHAWETSVGSQPSWSSWSQLGSGFNSQAQEFDAFLLQNTGQLQAVALGSTPNLYQSTQYAGGGHDSWSKFTTVGQTISPQQPPQFANGPAACYCTSTLNAVYAGYNANTGTSANPLVFCAPSTNPSYSFPQWGPVGNLTADQYPVSTAAPILISNFGTPQLVWLANGGQVNFVSQSPTSSNFWSNSIQTVGNTNPKFTGQMSAVVVSGNIGLCQLVADGSLAFINFQPMT